jgi:hypothetical protein
MSELTGAGQGGPAHDLPPRITLDDLPTIEEQIRKHDPVDAGRLSEEAARLRRGEPPLDEALRRESDGSDWHGARHGVD